LSSDYMLHQLNIDPVTLHKRLGDGFYEQKLVREQVAQLTGRRFLDGYANDEAEYRALINNGVTVARQWNLRPGIALTAEQMAALTSDIVWLVEKEVVLPNGQVAKALVPQLYIRVKPGDVDGSGALIAGDTVNLNLSGDLTNAGTIAGRSVVSLTAENVKNLGGRISGADAVVRARTDLDNLGGVIDGANSLTAVAGRDLNVISTTRSQTGLQSSRTHIDRVAGLYVSNQGGTLLAAAGRDANLAAAEVVNAGLGGSTTIAAGNNLNLGTVTQSSTHATVWNDKNYRKDASRQEVGTSIKTSGDIRLSAGNDLDAKATNVTSDQGALVATAGRNIDLTVGEASRSLDEAHQVTGSNSAFSKTTVATRDTLSETLAQGTTFSANTTYVQSNNDLNVKGSNIVSTDGTTLLAKNNINIEAATNKSSEGHFKDEKKSGLFGTGGIGFTVGTQQQSTDAKNTGDTAAASTVGAINGDINIHAGNAYQQVGSNVIAPQGNIDITAKKVDILETQNASQTTQETKFKQSGLTVALTTPVVSAIQTAQQMKEAGSQTKDTRMQVLAGATTALAAKNAADAVSQNPSQAGGINISISVGSSKSQSNTTQTSRTAAASTVAAGENVNITATGAGKESDITIQGSNIKAGNDATLKADDEINLLAAMNTAEQHSTNKSSSASIGVSFGTSGFLVTASASGARGNADGSDVTWTNAHVDAGNKLTLKSGGDMNLIGAVATGKQVMADTGGNLHIESLQDTSKFDSKQQSIGGSVSVGMGQIGGSVSFSKSKIDSNYASVTEQSGIKAGDGGYQVNVEGKTSLAGGVIASSDDAIRNGKNSFASKGEVTQTDIVNIAAYSAQSVSVSAGTGGSAGASAGIGRDSGSQTTITRSGIGVSTSEDNTRAIKPIFDAQKVQAEVNAQTQIMQAFSREAPKAVASIAGSQITKLKEQAKNETDPEKRLQLEAEQENWKEGGRYRVTLHTASGALSGGVAGAAGAAASASAAPLMDVLQANTQQVLQEAGLSSESAKAIAQGIAGVAAAGMGAVVGGAQGAGAAFAVDANNRQLHQREYDLAKKNAKLVARKIGITEQEAEGRIIAEMQRNSDKQTADATGGKHDYEVRSIIGCQNLNCDGYKTDPYYADHDYNAQHIARNHEGYHAGQTQLGTGQTYNELATNNIKKDPVGATLAGA
jgi:filamentous hemagglutinin